MKLNIKSAPRRSVPFSIELGGEDFKVKFSGNYEKKGLDIILEGLLTGDVQVTCGVSCQTFFTQMNEEICVKFVEGEFKGFDPKYDVIETDGEIDFEGFILEEIESFRLGYHVAPGVEFTEANL